MDKLIAILLGAVIIIPAVYFQIVLMYNVFKLEKDRKIRRNIEKVKLEKDRALLTWLAQ